MRRLKSLLLVMPAVALAACATSQGEPTAIAPRAAAATPADSSSYGLFLAGQAAINNGRGDAAATYFGQAAAAGAPDDASFLAARTFTAALLAGDVRKAALLAPSTASDGAGTRHLAGLTRGVEALAEGQAKQARAILTGPDVGAPHDAPAALLAPFAAAAAGDAEASIAQPVIVGDPVAQFFARLDQGKLFERAKRYDEAETAFRSLIVGGDPGAIASLSLGELLERRGKSADAVAIYDQALTRAPADETLIAAQTRAAAGRAPPPMQTLREAAAEALIAPASILIAQKQGEAALAYLRLALRLDPSRDSAWLLVGDLLADVGDADAARAAYLAPKPGSNEYVAARGKLAWNYQTAGDKQTALKIAQSLHEAAPASEEAATTLADLLRADERYDESAKVLDALIAAQGEHPDWRLLYMRAVDLQESGHWTEAERDLTAALKQHPGEPELLNFLGYSWIDRGEKLPQAIAMVKKAVESEPNSGAMQDSLGWGYYRLGDYKAAVEKLETAVVLEAADPDVNDHLGDAYWRVGRKTEARFQWSRVLTLSPSAKLKAQVEAKLRSGLDAPIASAVVAGS